MDVLVGSNLTHLSFMEFPTLIKWTSQFPFYGLVGEIFHPFTIFGSNFCKQTVGVMSHLGLHFPQTVR